MYESAFFPQSLYNKMCVILFNFLGKNFNCGSYEEGSSGDGEKCLDSRYILREKPIQSL